ncbi:MAG TPA: cupredoxin domain-containing protein [Gemmatimonadales bacterium]|nr:cupredoxin domain-containing protein [Gemmatimonadales bacterium]
MTVSDAVVVVGGLALIAWELWYFLAPRKAAPGAEAPAKSGVQEIKVLVKNGYDPDTILVEAGRPVRLHFYRDETAECSERVVFDSLGIDQVLPPFQTTTIEFMPTQPGDYPFRCGMSILKGRVVAQVGREAARLNLGRGHAKHA